MKLRVVLYGVGSIGSMVARRLLARDDVDVVGAVDVDPAKVGRDLGDVVGLGREVGVVVSDDAGGVLSGARPDLVIHTTRSFLGEVFDQIMTCIRHGANVLSTCEELSHPFISDPDLAKRLDEAARRAGVTVLGTGINPGFLMDTLPIVLSAVCQEVRSITVRRSVDAARRRLPFQEKIGAGLTVGEFEEKIRTGAITGHVGLRQSVALIADALGWRLDGIVVEPTWPVVAEREVRSDYITVRPGRVAGLRQVARGLMGGRAVITLELTAYMGAEEFDSVDIDGRPEIHMRIRPCVHGDEGTVGIIINMMRKVVEAPPGLLTMKDMPLPSATPGSQVPT
ncbi:dihydrodipicolinate reductase [Candidatus Bathyarchaeota archaeon]|nr:MAG: dihydrodipicolinate reductase [Candidatus Bathyarchaeota archaeon]